MIVSVFSLPLLFHILPFSGFSCLLKSLILLTSRYFYRLIYLFYYPILSFSPPFLSLSLFPSLTLLFSFLSLHLSISLLNLFVPNERNRPCLFRAFRGILVVYFQKVGFNCYRTTWWYLHIINTTNIKGKHILFYTTI